MASLPPKAEVQALTKYIASNALLNRQLSAICNLNGLKTTGVKNELQKRIIACTFWHGWAASSPSRLTLLSTPRVSHTLPQSTYHPRTSASRQATFPLRLSAPFIHPSIHPGNTLPLPHPLRHGTDRTPSTVINEVAAAGRYDRFQEIQRSISKTTGTNLAGHAGPSSQPSYYPNASSLGAYPSHGMTNHSHHNGYGYAGSHGHRSQQTTTPCTLAPAAMSFCGCGPLWR